MRKQYFTFGDQSCRLIGPLAVFAKSKRATQGIYSQIESTNYEIFHGCTHESLLVGYHLETYRISTNWEDDTFDSMHTDRKHFKKSLFKSFMKNIVANK